MIYTNTKQNNAGFALLLTLVVVSVVLAIGLSLIDTTLKQLVLSGTGRDAEIAFHAAYAGSECGLYWRTVRGNVLLGDATGVPTAPTLDSCLDEDFIAPLGYTRVHFDASGAQVHLAEYQINWGTAPNERCSEIDIYMYDARPLSVGTLNYDIPFYVDSSTEACTAGNVCTAIFSRGYNRGCADIGSIRTVQQEVVLTN